MNLHDILEREEGSKIEFKRETVLDRSEEIARQLVALANRQGGSLVFGITDEREIEGAEIDEDSAKQQIANIARTKCSPRIRFESQHRALPDGDIFQVEVKPRESQPHAIVEKSNGEIVTRQYRIRAENTTRLVDDHELQWLFRQDSDIEISHHARYWISYADETLGIPRLTFPDGTSRGLGFLLSELSDEDRDYLLANADEGRISRYFIATLPIGYLAILCFEQASSWKSEKRQLGFGSTFDQDPSVPMQSVDFAEVPIHGAANSVLSELEVAFDESPILREFKTPPEVEVSLHLNVDNSNRTSVIKFVREGRFDFEIRFSLRGGMPGLPREHPEVNQDNPREERFTTLYYEIDFESDFAFPDERDPDLGIHHEYAQNLVDVIRRNWDIDQMLEELPDDKLYELERKVDEIRSVLIPDADVYENGP